MRRHLSLGVAVLLAVLGAAGPGTQDAGAATIGGTVRDDAGTAVAGTYVTVYTTGEAPAYYDGASTGPDGRYTVTDLPAGRYRVGFSAPGGSGLAPQYHRDRSTLAAADEVDLATESSAATGVDAALHPGARITGTVTGAGAGPLAEAFVTVLDAEGDFAAFATTDAAGEYEATGLAEGTYRVQFSPGYGENHLPEYFEDAVTFEEADPIPLAGGQIRAGVDAELAVGGRIRGRVTDAETGGPAAGVWVSLAADEESPWLGSGFATTDANGEYAMPGVATGQHVVEFRSSFDGKGYRGQYFDGATQLADADPVGVTAGADTTGIHAAMDPAGRIKGVVRDTEGQPVAGIQVGVAPHAPDGGYQPITNVVRTDAAGRYELSGLEAGPYRVSFFDPAGVYDAETYDDATGAEPPTPVEVQHDGTTEGIDATLRAPGRIAGRVTDETTGDPIPYAGVMVFSESGAYVTSAFTDADGRYTATRLNTGTYRVSFSGANGGPAPPPTVPPPGGPTTTGPTAPSGPADTGHLAEFYDDQPSLASATPVAVTDGRATAGIDARLERGGRIEGRLVDDADGTGIPNTPVVAHRADGGYAGQAYTDASGRYEFRGLATGSYRIEFVPYGGAFEHRWHDGKATFGDADPVAVTQGETATLGETRLHRGATISGRVLVDGSDDPAVGTSVMVLDADTRNHVASASVGADGRYSATGIPPGTYTVRFAGSDFVDEYYDGKGHEDADRISIVRGEQRTGIDASLARGATIRGVVRDAETGAPSANATVLLRTGSIGYYAFTASDGSYNRGGLPPGTYRVSFSNPSRGYEERWYDDADSFEAATPIVLASGETADGIDGALHVGRQIVGTVTAKPSGAPVAGVSVTASRVDGTGSHSTTTDDAGDYRISGLTAGDYTVRFSSQGDVNVASVYFDGKSRADADRVAVVTRGATRVDQALDPGGRVTGVVRDAETGEPVPDVSVRVSGSAAGDHHHLSARSGADGRYTVAGVPTGTFSLYFAPESGGFHRDRSGPSVDVTAGQDTAVEDVGLETGGRIAGRVTDGEDGTPVRWTSVTAYDANGSYAGWASTGSDGRYSLGVLAPGDYRVEFNGGSGPEGHDYGRQHFDQRSSQDDADTVTVARRAVTADVDARMAPLAATTTPPTVTGVARQGQTLSATQGVWAHAPTSVARQWMRCSPTVGDGCWEIGGATEASYVLGLNDASYRIAVRERAVTLGGTTDATSTPTDVVVPLPPVSQTAPRISGLSRSGERLSASTGTWANGPTDFTYRWKRCTALGSGCEDVPGATEATYDLGDADIDHTLLVEVVASNAGGDSEPAASAASSRVRRAVPTVRTGPSVSGEARQGATLTADRGTWDGEPTGYRYDWRRCAPDGQGCSSLGASGTTYEPRAADVGATIRVAVTAFNDGGDSLPATSGPTATIVATRPVNTSVPRISGVAKVGETLTGDHGAWRNEPTAYTYTWLSCPDDGACAPIDGATGTSFAPTEAEVDHAIALRVVATNSAGDGLAATSARTAAVQPRVPGVVDRPTIAGTTIEGQNLTLGRGAWTNAPTSYEQQWLRCVAGDPCAEIAGATGETYALTAADVDARIAVRERAINESGAGAWATSEQTAPVVAGPPMNRTVPVVNGTAREGGTLVADHGEWTNAPTAYDHQWLRCPTAGDCVAINGETSDRYVARFADVGSGLAVEVRARNSGGTSAPARSVVTDPVSGSAPPETTISNRPDPVVNGATQRLDFHSDRPDVTFECQLDAGDFAPCDSPKSFTGLPEGDHTFAVRATDDRSRTDDTPATATWVIDRTAPETTITDGPATPVHDDAVFAFTSSEPGSTFACALDNGAYRPCASGDPLDLDRLSPGPHTLRVRATDAVGNVDASSATRTFELINETPSAVLDVTPEAGAAELEVQVALAGTDGDGDPLSYELDFGDGTRTDGRLPHGDRTHTYAQPGIYLVRLAVSDGHEVDVRTHRVTVVLAEPLRANAGDDLVAVAGETVTLDGGGSRPTAGISSATWQLGDGRSRAGARVQETYAQPGTYTARLTVEAGGQSATDEARVRVVAASEATGIGVDVSSGGGPVGRTDVLVIGADGRRYSALTDAAGRARLHGLPDGTHTVMAYAEGYRPTSAPATVRDGSGIARVELTPGAIAEATLTHRRLDRDEIVAYGIDPDDPENQVVRELTVALDGGPVKIAAPGGGSGFVGANCSRNVCTYDRGGATTTVTRDGDRVTTFTLPFQARWLKEFFEVKMTVHNLASPEFVLRSGVARLSLPPGLSLAPTSRGEQLAKQVGDIAGGSRASVAWIVRGDAAGQHHLGADYAAVLDPIGRSVTVGAATATPLRVWGADAIKPIVEADEEYRDGHPMRVRVGLQNVADIPVTDAEVELLEDGRRGYQDQPRQQRVHRAQEIPPGETAWLGPWIVVPESSGAIDLADSFLKRTRGDGLGDFEIRTAPREPALADTPELTPKNLGDGLVKLDWDPVPGATDYEVYAVPDRTTPFADEPVVLDRVEAGASGTVGTVAAPAAGQDAYYAVSAIVGGRNTMVHPVVKAPAAPAPGTGDDDPFGPPDPDCNGANLTGSVKIESFAELAADSCFTKDGDVYTASGRVRVNGVDLFAENGKITVDVGKGRVTATDIRLKLGNTVLYQGQMDWLLRGEKTFKIPAGTQFKKLSLGGSLTVRLLRDRADLEAEVDLPKKLSQPGMEKGAVGTLKLGATLQDGPRLDLFEIGAERLQVGRLGIDDVKLQYHNGEEGEAWSGKVQLSIPRPISPLILAGELKIVDGQFRRVAVEAKDMNVHVTHGVFLQRLQGGFELDPLAVEGGIGVSFGPSVRLHGDASGTSLVSVEGNVRASFGEPQKYSVSGTLSVLGTPVRSGYVRYDTSGAIEFGGSMGFEKSGAKLKAEIDGWVEGTDAASATGRGEVSAPGFSVEAEAIVSTEGVAACASSGSPSVGIGYRWADEDVTIFGNGCDIGQYEPARRSASRAAGAPSGFTVAEEEPVQVLAFRGEDAAPQVVLTGPDGERIAAPDGGEGIQTGDVKLVQFPEHRTTYVAISDPTPGEWTVTTAAGSAAVTRVDEARALPEPKAAATVERAGDRATLRWRVRPIEGQRVDFVERTDDGGRVIASTNEATGSAEFEPLAGADAGSTVEAVVVQDGLPRRTIIAVKPIGTEPPATGSGDAATPDDPPTGAAGPDTAGPGGKAAPDTDGPAPQDGAPAAAAGAAATPRPAGPRAVRVTRRGRDLVVTWPAARGAARYAVLARLPGGRRVSVERRGRRVVLRGVPARGSVRVSVRTVVPDGTRSTPTITTRVAVAR